MFFFHYVYSNFHCVHVWAGNELYCFTLPTLDCELHDFFNVFYPTEELTSCAVSDDLEKSSQSQVGMC